MMIMMILVFSMMAHAQNATPFFADLENFRKQSLSLQTEQQNLEAASASYLSSQFFWTPRLSLSANQTRTRLNAGATSDQNTLVADATLNLYRAGSDWNTLESRKSAKLAQQLQLENESLRVELRAADFIFKSIYLIQSKKIQDDLLKLKEDALRILNDRFHQGQLPLQEVRKSEVDLVQQRNRARQAALDSLENESEIHSAFVSEIQTKSWPFQENTTPKLQSAPRVPSVEQKYWFSQAQEQSWKAAKGGHWPTIDLSVEYQQSPIKDRDSSQWVGILQLTLPIWSQYETSAKIASAYAQYVSSQNDFKETQEHTKYKYEFLKQKIEVARTNLIEAKANVEKAKELYQSILKSFRMARLSTNDLLIEQNRLLDSQTALLLSQLSFHQTLIETCALVGLPSSTCLR